MPLFIDIETIPNESLERFLPEVTPPANYKELETIGRWWAENAESARQEQVAKMALDPCLFRLRALALAAGVDDEPEVWLVSNEAEERAALTEFWRGALRNKLIVGYNVLAFDLPRLLWRSMMLGLTPSRILNIGRYSKDALDLMLLLKGGDPRVTSLAGMGLKQVCALLDLLNSWPGGNGARVAVMSDAEVVKYAANDIQLLQGLYRWMAGVYFESSEIEMY